MGCRVFFNSESRGQSNWEKLLEKHGCTTSISVQFKQHDTLIAHRHECERVLQCLRTTTGLFFVVPASTFTTYCLHLNDPDVFQMGPLVRGFAPDTIHTGRVFRVDGRLALVSPHTFTGSLGKSALDCLEDILERMQVCGIPVEPEQRNTPVQRRWKEDTEFTLEDIHTLNDGRLRLVGNNRGKLVCALVDAPPPQYWLQFREAKNQTDIHTAMTSNRFYPKSMSLVDVNRFYYNTHRQTNIVRVPGDKHLPSQLYKRHMNTHITPAMLFLLGNGLVYGDRVRVLGGQVTKTEEPSHPDPEFTVVAVDFAMNRYPHGFIHSVRTMTRGSAITTYPSIEALTNDWIDSAPVVFVAFHRQAAILTTLLAPDFVVVAIDGDPSHPEVTLSEAGPAIKDGKQSVERIVEQEVLQRSAERFHAMSRICGYIPFREMQGASKPLIFKAALQRQSLPKSLDEVLVFPTEPENVKLKAAEPFIKPGLVLEPVTSIDYSSCYPAIIAVHHIDAMGFRLPTPDLRAIYDKTTEGQMPRLMRDLIQKRRSLPPGPYNQALKLVANACTGVLGLILPILYNSMTAHARAYLTLAIKAVEKVPTVMVNHGNTDGFYASCKPEDQAALEQAVKAFDQTLQAPMRLVLEKTFKRVLFATGSAFAAVNGKAVDYKGMLPNQDGAPKFAQDYQKTIAAAILTKQAIDVDTLAQYTTYFFVKLLERTPRADLVIGTKVEKDISVKYRPDTLHGIYHWEQVTSREVYTEKGERIWYILVLDPGRGVMAEGVGGTKPIAYDRYIKGYMRKALRILGDETGSTVWEKAVEKFHAESSDHYAKSDIVEGLEALACAICYVGLQPGVRCPCLKRMTR